eukprot:TRINITY_DN10375_c0_g1_i13.p1 TRINITY_DN10375_c0_g1~~TRINITY_DN10375_c0_g1_i13.p1  ORF type:complete len:121 (+),score=12.64 TRINITY_DN10375_c0_g1_i13:186-548(+)
MYQALTESRSTSLRHFLHQNSAPLQSIHSSTSVPVLATPNSHYHLLQLPAYHRIHPLLQGVAAYSLPVHQLVGLVTNSRKPQHQSATTSTLGLPNPTKSAEHRLQTPAVLLPPSLSLVLR